jgi:hypothetical protein
MDELTKSFSNHPIFPPWISYLDRTAVANNFIEVENVSAAQGIENDASVQKALALKVPFTAGVSPPTVSDLSQWTGQGLDRAADRTNAGRSHGKHDTAVEESWRKTPLGPLARIVWERMKIDTGEAFRPDVNNYVGTKMVNLLMQLYERRGKMPRITLLGHSTGAIYICKFLQAVDAAVKDKPYQADVKFDIVFMAPAVRVDEFSYTLYRAGDRIRAFRMFGMSDDNESREPLIKDPPHLEWVYTRSLLYLVSGVCENDEQDYDDTPLLGMHRFFMGAAPFTKLNFPAIAHVQSFLDVHPNAVVRSDTENNAARGVRCTGRTHGGFPDDPSTRDSVCFLLRTGRYE